MDHLLLKPEDVARRLNVSRAKVYELVASGDLPAIHVGRSVRILSKALEAWVEATQTCTDGTSSRPATSRSGFGDPRNWT